MKLTTILIWILMLLSTLPVAAADCTLEISGNANEGDAINMQNLAPTESNILKSEIRPKLGDVNADGRITTTDSLLALAMAAGSIAPEMERADMNIDGRVNSLDALMIRMMVEKTQVCVNAPDVVSGAFEVTIDIHNVADLDSGQFDLSFDPGVVNVTAVNAGNISGTPIPVRHFFVDADTIRVLFNLPGATSVSGSGQIATINFETTGSQGATCVLDISDGHIFDTEADEIPALWNDCKITVGVPVTVNAHEIVSIVPGVFNATVEIGIEDVRCMNCGQFDLSFDSSVVNVTGVAAGNIHGVLIPILDWHFMDANTIRVVFELSDGNGVSGSGYVAEIDFEVTGSQGDVSVLDISNGRLTDTGGEEIPAVWTRDEVTIGIFVAVNAPPVVSGAFEVTIDLENVTDLDSGQFEILFDPDVVNVIGVHDGNIDGRTVPADCWSFVDADTIIAIFNLPIIRGVSGSGYVARIDFEITGSEGDTCVLDISNGLLVDRNADKIPAIWIDCEVAIGEYTPPAHRVHNLNTGEDFFFIHDAIDDTGTLDGHVIEVADGLYRENVQVTKSLTIRSENGSASCVIEAARRCENAVWVTVDCVNISGFTVKGTTFLKAGICLNAGHCNVSNNNCSNNDIGIRLEGSGNNHVSDNDCSNNRGAGIHLGSSSNNNVSSNNCSNNWEGIRLDGSSNNNISNNDCSNNWNGIRLYDSSNNSVSNNNCSNNRVYSIYLDGSSNNSVSNNNCSNNGGGISLRESCNNGISSNACSNNGDDGIHLYDSSNNRLTGNSMFENGIIIWGDSLSDYTHEIDTSNMVNGKPIYYLKDIESGRVPEGAGQVILVNCKGVLVEEQELNNASVGVDVAFSSNVTIKNNNCSNNNYYGIRLYSSSNNIVSGNNCSNNNWNGIRLYESCNNIVYLNNFINNADNIDSRSSTNIWNSTSKINYTYRGKTFANYLGNYRDDYAGSDSDNDGIGESPSGIDSDEDNYPLVMPIENYFVETENIQEQQEV